MAKTNAGITLKDVPWPVGSVVMFYPRISDQVLNDLPPTGVPDVFFAFVQPDGTLSIAPQILEDGQYWAAAPVTPGGRDYRWVGFGLTYEPPTQIPGPTGPTGAQGPTGNPQTVDQMRVNVNQPAGFVVGVFAKAVFSAPVRHGDAAQYTLQGTGNNTVKIRDAGVYYITAGTSGIGSGRHAHSVQTGSWPVPVIDSGRVAQAGDVSPSASTCIVVAVPALETIQLDVLAETLAVVQGFLTIGKLGL